ncbi:MAG: DJ-1/PfpI family protein [Firmicutes bacterium]|nr:DJ-1/PfpI family protein [Bacillota bacterium]
MRFVCLLADGFEDIEAIGTVALLKRSGIEVELVSVFGKKTVTGAFQTEVVVNTKMSSIDVDEYDGIFIPGGRQAYVLRDTPSALELVIKFSEQQKWLMAICAGPSVFGVIGLLDGKHYTSFPGTEVYMPKGIRENALVVTDGNIITGIGAGAVHEFAFEIIKNVLGKDKADEIKKRTLYKAFETRTEE